MKRTERQTIAHATLEIVKLGSYQSPSGRMVSLEPEVKAARDGTRLYGLQDLPVAALPLRDRAAVIEVTNESTFAAARRLYEATASHVACLNFASAKNPGGGFLNGAEAQEEALARASALYDCLLCAPRYYEQNRAENSCIYLDLVIASPAVPFFRDDSGNLLETLVPVTVITAPAPNAGAVRRNEPDRIPGIDAALRRRAEMVLRVAVLHGVDCLVLGAWGCGVFQNDPRKVAAVFRELLTNQGPYARSFDRVVFAVFDPGGDGPNFTAFREVFGR